MLAKLDSINWIGARRFLRGIEFSQKALSKRFHSSARKRSVGVDITAKHTFDEISAGGKKLVADTLSSAAEQTNHQQAC